MTSTNIRCSSKTLVLVLSIIAVLAIATSALVLSPVASAAGTNSLVYENGNPYEENGNVFTFNFGSTALSMPHPETGSDDLLSFTLIKKAGSKEEYKFNFGVNRWEDLITVAMPAGTYELQVKVATSATDDTVACSATYGINILPVTYDVTPGVKAAYDALIASLTTAKFAFTSQLQLIEADTEDCVKKLNTAIAGVVERKANTEWAKPAYDKFYTVELVYNTPGMSVVNYSTLEEAYTWYDDYLINITDPGNHKIYYNLRGNNFQSLLDETQPIAKYEAQREDFYYMIRIEKVVELPTINSVVYNEYPQKADIRSTIEFNVLPYTGFVPVGTHEIYLKVTDGYVWAEGTKLLEGQPTVAILEFEITKADNIISNVDMLPWTEGNYEADIIESNESGSSLVEKSPFVASTRFSAPVRFVLREVEAPEDAAPLYDSGDPERNSVDILAALPAGTYYLEASTPDTENFNGDTASALVHVLKKVGLPGWVVAIIAVGSALVVVAVFVILAKKGVFQILTGKLVIAIRTQATIDATIAAVRASKVAEASKQSRAEAEAKEKAEQLRQAREAERQRPAEERAAALEEKAAQAAQRAARMKNRAESLRGKAGTGSNDDSNNSEN